MSPLEPAVPAPEDNGAGARTVEIVVSVPTVVKAVALCKGSLAAAGGAAAVAQPQGGAPPRSRPTTLTLSASGAVRR